MPIDTSFFEKKAKEYNTPRGSKIPHPADWKGAKRTMEQPHKDGLILPADLDKYVAVHQGNMRKRKLTEKQKRYVQLIMQGYTRHQAALRAGYSLHSAQSLNVSNGS